MRKFISLVVMVIFSASVIASDSIVPNVKWEKQVINADSKFETAGIGDIDGDGQKDIVCGSYWYKAPDWEKHFIIELKETNNYYDDFANELQDVDGDGNLDVVSVAYFSKQCMWRENPGTPDGKWIQHVFDEPGNMETAIFADINGNGVMDLFPNNNKYVVWYEKTAKKGEHDYWIKHVVGTEGNGHGHGAGDVNADGVMDILTPHGWYKGKKSGNEMTWTWRPEFELGRTSNPILAHDVNGDGLNDIIWGLGHDYGIYWLEQKSENGKRTWNKHLIDKSWSQPHYIDLFDAGNDGVIDLIAGKRYHAHNGKDPGGNDPLCIYLYTYDKKTNDWKRSVVDENTKTGFGLHPAIGDIDEDGDVDLVCPGKSGLFLLKQSISKK